MTEFDWSYVESTAPSRYLMRNGGGRAELCGIACFIKSPVAVVQVARPQCRVARRSPAINHTNPFARICSLLNDFATRATYTTGTLRTTTTTGNTHDGP